MRVEATREPMRITSSAQIEMLADARSQVIDPQIDRADPGETRQALRHRLVHVARAQCGHHRQTRHRIETGADHAAVKPVVGEVPDQFAPHVDAPADELRRDRGDLEPQ